MNRSILSRLFLVSVVLLLIIFISNQKVFSENWVFLGKAGADKTDFYYKNDIKIHLSPSIKKVWVKDLKPLKSILEDRKKAGLPISIFSHYAYILDLVEIDCKEKEFRVLYSAYLSKDGKVLNSKKIADHKPISIPHESIANELYKAVCF